MDLRPTLILCAFVSSVLGAHRRPVLPPSSTPDIAIAWYPLSGPGHPVPQCLQRHDRRPLHLLVQPAGRSGNPHMLPVCRTLRRHAAHGRRNVLIFPIHTHNNDHRISTRRIVCSYSRYRIRRHKRSATQSLPLLRHHSRRRLHSVRFLLMHADTAGMHIVTASALAALITGTMAVLLSTRAGMPAETFLFQHCSP